MPWLFLAYPLLAHLATLIHSERLAGIALTVFFAIPLLPLLHRGRPEAWLALLAIAAMLYACAAGGFARYLMYAPPVLIPLSVFWLFARSLRPGRVPMVTRVATRIRGELPAELRQYTRRVTEGWALLLILMAGGSVLLALFATPGFWSLMTNIVQYLLLGMVFLLEYLYRRWRFRHLQHESFGRMVAALFRTGLR